MRGESRETWTGFSSRDSRLLTGFFPPCHPWSGEGVSPGRSSAWSSVNLVFSLKRVRECFPPTSLRAATSGLAAAPALVYSLGKKTRSLLIQRDRERETEKRERGAIDGFSHCKVPAPISSL